MKKKVLFVKAFMTLLFAGLSMSLSLHVAAQSTTVTYSAGNIPSNDGSFSASCNGAATPLTVTIPAEANVTSVDVSYTINTTGGSDPAWTIEQRSRLRFLNDDVAENGPEFGFFRCDNLNSGASGDCGQSFGVTNYTRTGLTIANGVSATGILNFGLEVFGVFPSSSLGCSEDYNFVPNNSWVITVNYETGSDCAGTPNPGNTLSSSINPCASVNFTLSLQNPLAGGGVSYQWQTSPDGSTWSNAVGSPDAASWTTSQTSANWYRCIVSCSFSSESTPSAGIEVFSTACYCEPTYDIGKLEGDLISNVEIPGTTLANNSGTAPVNPAYTYFTGQPNYTADLVQGGSYNVTISIGTWGSQAIRAWIDYNDDGVFDDTESIGSTTVGSGFSATGFPPAVFNVNLSNSAPLGTHRMRIRGAYNQNAATLSPCLEYTYGETEDYDITIVAPVTTQLQAGSCGATDVAPNQLLFATNVNAPQYRFRFTGDNNGGPGWNNDQFIVDRPHRYVYFNHLLPGFQFGATYSVEVAVGDGFGNFGPYGAACDVTLVSPAAAPLSQVQTSQCGASVNGNTLIFANQIFDAQGYRFRITGSNNGGAGWNDDVFIVDRPNRNFYFSWLVPGATPGATFSVEVAYLQNDGVTYSPYGAACDITLNPQTTQIQASQCGATDVMPNALVFANQVFDAQGYRFRITGANNGGAGWNDDVFILDRPNRNFNFQWGVPGSLAGETYEVEVAFLQNDGVTYSAYGAMCEITLFGTAEFVLNNDNEIFQDNKSMISVEFGANASHNPFTTDFGLQVLNANDTETINVNVYDMSGKLIERNAVNAMDIETARFGANLAVGMYMIEVRQGSNQAVIRQVKN